MKVAINQLFISEDALFYSLSSPSLQALLIIFLIIIMIIFIIIMLGILTSVHKLLGVSVVKISVEFPQLVSPGDCNDDDDDDDDDVMDEWMSVRRVVRRIRR